MKHLKHLKTFESFSVNEFENKVNEEVAFADIAVMLPRLLQSDGGMGLAMLGTLVTAAAGAGAISKIVSKIKELVANKKIKAEIGQKAIDKLVSGSKKTESYGSVNETFADIAVMLPRLLQSDGGMGLAMLGTLVTAAAGAGAISKIVSKIKELVANKKIKAEIGQKAIDKLESGSKKTESYS